MSVEPNQSHSKQMQINRVIKDAIAQGYDFYEEVVVEYNKKYPDQQKMPSAEEQLRDHIARQLRWEVNKQEQEKIR